MPFGGNAWITVTVFSLWCNGKEQIFTLSVAMKECNNEGNVRTKYRGADKSLARPGRKQARKHVRAECC